MPHICREPALLGPLLQPTGRSQGQKHSHTVVWKILLSRVHDNAKPKPDILGWGEGGRNDPVTEGGGKSLALEGPLQQSCARGGTGSPYTCSKGNLVPSPQDLSGGNNKQTNKQN